MTSHPCKSGSKAPHIQNLRADGNQFNLIYFIAFIPKSKDSLIIIMNDVLGNATDLLLERKQKSL